jgi:hypothetical protein
VLLALIEENATIVTCTPSKRSKSLSMFAALSLVTPRNLGRIPTRLTLSHIPASASQRFSPVWEPWSGRKPSVRNGSWGLGAGRLAEVVGVGTRAKTKRLASCGQGKGKIGGRKGQCIDVWADVCWRVVSKESKIVCLNSRGWLARVKQEITRLN